MNCKLIFYAARKTSFCERALQKSFSELDLKLEETAFATESAGLGELLTNAFSSVNIVFVVGGFELGSDKGIVNIISKACSACDTDDCKKLKNDLGDDGYVIRAANQILVLLPDEPEQIEVIMQGPLSGYIGSYCKTTNIVRV